MALWSASGSGYTLPNPTLSGGMMNQINQYFQDESATCNTGPTPGGCGATYLNTSTQGSLAGTGPYVLTSSDATSGTITLTARSGYWGGPDAVAIQPQIKTVIFKFVPDVPDSLFLPLMRSFGFAEWPVCSGYGFDSMRSSCRYPSRMVDGVCRAHGAPG